MVQLNVNAKAAVVRKRQEVGVSGIRGPLTDPMGRDGDRGWKGGLGMNGS